MPSIPVTLPGERMGSCIRQCSMDIASPNVHWTILLSCDLDVVSVRQVGPRVANLSALDRGQDQQNQKVPSSESKNTLFDPRLGTHLNARLVH